MVNPFKEINWQPDAADLRRFAISIMIGFPLLALGFVAVLWIRRGEMPDAAPVMGIGLAGLTAGVLSLMAPWVARPLYFIWFALGACIGIVVSNLVFAAVFYLMFTPLGVFVRLMGRDPLRLKRQADAVTYWQDAPPPPPPRQYFKQY